MRSLIGYYAQVSRLAGMCNGDALVVMGAKAKLRAQVARQTSGSAAQCVLKKAWFDEILAGLRLGAAYAFDEEAYNRFYPLGQQAGLTVGPEDFSSSPPLGLTQPAIHFVRVQCR
jgi:hypothetical protein